MKTSSTQVGLRHALTLALLCAPLAAGCFQPVDEGATKGTIDQMNQAAIPAPEGPVKTTSTPDTPSGTLTNGEVATEGSGCGVTDDQAMDILTTSCAVCHTGEQPVSGVQGFDILDLSSIKTGITHGPLYAGKNIRYLVPGDPEKSVIYYRIVRQSMPPTGGDISRITGRLPTISDYSLLNAWIKNCVGTDTMPGVGDDPAGG